MRNKYLCMIITLMLAVGLLAALTLSASADEPLTEGDYQYVIHVDEEDEAVRTAEITGYTGEDAAVLIPASLGGAPVTAVKDGTFQNKDFITSAVLPDTVTDLGRDAFRGCANLESVTLSDALVTIGDYAFYNCTALTEIEIPATLTSVRHFYSNTGPFKGCSALTDVTFANGIAAIPDYLFSECTGLQSITIPNTVTTIGSYAFRSCANLTAVTIPDSVISIAGSAFDCCAALAEVEIPASVTTIEENVFCNCTSLATVMLPATLTNIKSYAFSGCTSLENITLPAALTTVGAYAFNNCTSLPAINIPKSLTEEGSSVSYPFSGCSSLTTVTYEQGITTIPATLFEKCSGLTEAAIPATVTQIGKEAFYGCPALTTVDLPDSVTHVGEYAFCNCDALTAVSLSGSLTDLDSGAFANCDALEAVEIPKSLTTAGTAYYGPSVYGPFYDCDNLKTFTFEAGVTAIPGYLFARCYTLEELTIPATVTSIGEKAFYECYGLSDLTIPALVESIGYGAFYKCGALTEVTIPDAVTEIPGYAFYECSGLETLDLGAGVATIRSSAFTNCASLTGVTLPSGLTKVETYAFSNCGSLTDVWIPKSLTEAENGVTGYMFSHCPLENVTFEAGVTQLPDKFFYGCNGMTKLTVPNTVTSIGSYAFNGCAAMTEITIPASVQTIGDHAFYDCKALTSLSVPAGVTAVPAYLCVNCDALTEVELPDTLESIGYSAFYGCDTLAAIEIPVGVTAIDGAAFEYCAALTDVSLPNTLESIGGWAFRGCTALESIVLPASLTTIGENAFYECTALSSVNIPKALVTAQHPFMYCSALDHVTFEAGRTEIPSNLFYYCTGLTSMDIPDTVTAIGSSAFAYCTNLAAVTLPEGLESLSGYAFNNTGLTTVHIPASLVTLADNYGPFAYCANLKTATFEAGRTVIPANLFYRCTGLEEIVIPDTVTEIGYNAFNQCTALESVTLSASLETIGQYAFQNCDALLSVVIPDSVTTLGHGIFKDCDALFWVDLGAGVTNLSYYEFGTCPALETVIFRAADVTVVQSVFSDSVENVTFYGRHGAETLRAGLEQYYPDAPFIGTDAHTGMTWTWTGFTAATLTLTCDDCDIGQRELPAAITSEVTTAPTCTETGVRTYTATATLLEDFVYTDQKTEPVDPIGHDWGAWTKISSTKHRRVCANDPAHVETKSHTWNAGVVTTPATCTADGVRTYTCTVCRGTKTAAVAATGHVWGVWTKLDDTQHQRVCANDASHKEQEAHTWDEGVITTAPTCTEQGVKTFTCAVCNGTKTEAVAALGHIDDDRDGVCDVCRFVIVATPEAPQNVTVAPTADKTLTVRWDASDGATQYNVYRFNEAKDAYVYRGTTSAAATRPTQYVDAGLTAGTVYSYKVTAVKKAQGLTLVSAFSAPAGAEAVTTPAVPANVTVTPTADRTLTVGWTASEGATQYNIYRYNAAKDAFAYHATVRAAAADPTHYTDGDLAAWTVYSYKVVAVTKAADLTLVGEKSDAVSGRAIGVPAAPQNVTAAPAADGALTVRWDAVEGASRYHVYRSDDAEDGYVLIGSVSADGETPTQYEDSGLATGSVCYYKVTAEAQEAALALASAFSDAASAEVIGTPAVPVNVTVTPTAAKTLTVGWDASEGATQYNIYRSSGGAYSYKATVRATAADPTHYADKNLAAWTVYSYKVVAVTKEAGLTLASEKSEAAEARAVGTPAVPANVTVTPTAARTLTVRWDASEGATQYNVYRFNETKNAYVYKGTTFATADAPTQYADKNLTAGAVYSYKVVAAVKEAGLTLVSEKSEAAEAAAVGAPAAPENVAVAPTAAKTLTVRWDAVEGATRYDVYRYNGQQKAYLFRGSVAADADDPTSFTEAGLNAGTNYYYKVTAVIETGGVALASARSASASARAVGAPAAPKNVVVTPTAEKTLTVGWDAVAGAARYDVYRYNGQLKDYVLKGSVSANAENPTSFTEAGLNAGTNYYYRVVAVTETAGLTLESARSASVSARALGTPAVPKNVTAVSNETGTVTVSWSPSTGATSYEVYRYNGTLKAYILVATVDDACCDVTGLHSGTTYHFKVAAVTEGSGLTFVSAQSSSVSAKVK